MPYLFVVLGILITGATVLGLDTLDEGHIIVAMFAQFINGAACVMSMLGDYDR